MAMRRERAFRRVAATGAYLQDTTELDVSGQRAAGRGPPSHEAQRDIARPMRLERTCPDLPLASSILSAAARQGLTSMPRCGGIGA